MEDRRTIEELFSQIKNIDDNISNNVEYISSIELLLTSNNNGTDKDNKVSSKFFELKEKLEQAMDATHELTSMLEHTRED